MKIPNADHPITIEPNPKRVAVKFNGRTVAETIHALTLREANLPAVQYIPLGRRALAEGRVGAPA